MSTRIESKEQVVAFAKQLIAGAAKHLNGTTQVALLGGTFTPAEITTKLQSIVTLRSDVDTAKATAKAKVAAETASMPALRTFMGAFVSFVKAAYGTSPDVLADFGIHPTSRAPLTVQAKAAAAAKREATRAARHTMGTQQKKKVKGTVTGVVVTPIEAGPSIVTTGDSPPTAAASGSVPAVTPPATPATSGSAPTGSATATGTVTSHAT